MLDLQDAITLFEEGDPRKAADLLEKLAAEMPGYAAARVLLARSYERLDEWEAALRAWREVNQIIPNSPVVRRGLERAARKAATRSLIQPTRVTEAPQEPAEAGKERAEPQEPAEPAPRPEAQHRPEPAPRPGPEHRPELQHRAEPQAEPEPKSQAEPESEAQAEPAPEAQREPEPERQREPEPEAQREPVPKPRRASRPEREFSRAPEIEASDAADEFVDVDESGASQPESTEAGTAETAPETAEYETAEPKEAEARRGRGFEDLDRLISELESARIVPRPDLDELPAPDLEDDIEDVVSETLARIYASQGQYDEAAHVYELLAGQQPEKAEEFQDKASEMRSRASEQE